MDLLRAEALTKRFGGVLALDAIDMSVAKGEIHSIVGENGAGKSTLLKIVSGIIKADDGELYFDGERITNGDPNRLFARGISAAFQETSLCDNLTVTENLYLGRLYRHRGLAVDWRSAAEETAKSLEGFGIRGVDPRAKVSGLSPETRQMLEIVKSVKENAKLVSLDEPTASLTKEGVGLLFRLLGGLKARGVAVLYVSHHLDEVLELSDRITVFRDGRKVGTIERADASERRLHEMMIGRSIARERRRGREAAGAAREPVLKVDGVGDGMAVSEVSFEVREGEILGITGLVGAGRSELAWLLFGLAPKTHGKVFYRGRELQRLSPAASIREGVFYLPEERRSMGLFLNQSLAVNTTISRLDRITKGRIIDFKKERTLTERILRRLGVKYATLEQEALSLSGGNQQKLLLGKCLFTEPRLLILDEPTKGIDVGSKEEIYELVFSLAREGTSVVVVSSEVEEIVLLCDRVLVMSEGNIIGTFTGDEINEHTITACYLKTAGA
jgi:ribose transport system ATP-binding protein